MYLLETFAFERKKSCFSCIYVVAKNVGRFSLKISENPTYFSNDSFTGVKL